MGGCGRSAQRRVYGHDCPRVKPGCHCHWRLAVCLRRRRFEASIGRNSLWRWYGHRRRFLHGLVILERRAMSKPVAYHRVYRSMNKTLTIWGAERGLFFLALFVGAATFNFFSSITSGLAMFVGLLVFG